MKDGSWVFEFRPREREREIEIEDGEEKVRLSPGWWWLALSDEDH